MMNPVVDLKRMQSVLADHGADFSPYLFPRNAKKTKATNTPPPIVIEDDPKEDQKIKTNRKDDTSRYCDIDLDPLQKDDKRRLSSLMLYKEDVQRLETSNKCNKDKEMNDNLADAGIQVLLNDRNVCSAELRPKVSVYSTHFYGKISDNMLSPYDRFCQVQRWDDGNCFRRDFIMFPIVGNGHWSLVVLVRPYLILVCYRLSLVHYHEAYHIILVVMYVCTSAGEYNA